MTLRPAQPFVCRYLGPFFVAMALTTSCSEDRPDAPQPPNNNDINVGDTSAPCVDEDGDGFGTGCDTGRDCDDTDSAVTTDCALADCSRTPTAPGCDCPSEGVVIDCGEMHEQFGDTVVCGYGRQTCDTRQWSGCRINSLPGRLRQALVAPAECPTNPCDPYCKEFLDSPDYESTPTGVPVCTIEATCQDGIQNQAEVGIDCEGPCAKACGTVGSVLSANFSSGVNGFSYADDVFRGTNAASSASGNVAGGQAVITLGQIPLSGPTSGGMTQTFSSSASVDVTFDWSIEMDAGFLVDECGEVLISIDGIVYGDGSDDFVASLCGTGRSSGSFSFASNFLTSGDHTLVVGGYLNKNASPAAVTRFDVENYTDYNNPRATGGNDAGRAGDKGFETCGDTDGGLNVTQLSSGDFIEWEYTAPETGTYAINLRVAGASPWTQNLKLDGGGTTMVLSGAATGGPQIWQTITSDTFSLTAGLHTLRIASSGSQSPNLNFVEILSPTTGPETAIAIDNVLITSTSGGVCGDNSCAAPETCTSCASDCGACPITNFCGDATCDTAQGETCGNCETDCGDCGLSCGDGTCDAGDGETCGSCETDCGTCSPGPTCGNGVCATGESCSTCESDCGACECGDGTCGTGEDCSSCAADCGACVVSTFCGDATCDADESCSDCASDCGVCAVAGCGDGTCDAGESCSTCATDCEVCSICGDATCDTAGGESCSTCSSDCGACVITGATQVYLEAECATTATGNYGNASSFNVGASGTKHIRSNGQSTANPYDNTSTDHATYDVDVVAGSYDIYFLVDTQNSAVDDSWFYRIDSGSWNTENNHVAIGYRWVKGVGGSQALSGAHTIEIANREDGLDFDRIAVVPAGTVPSGVSVTPTNCNTCGNGTIEGNEGCSTCAKDVGACPPALCGNSVCDSGETCSSCETDCGECPVAGCGDGTCDGPGEACDSCAVDCGACVPAAYCGDASCDAVDGETCDTCESDCGSCSGGASAGCGDGTCDGTESCDTCALDCGVCRPGPYCGDATCDGGESCGTCATDCGTCAARELCGDSTCDDEEDCNSCATDCTSCGAPATCGDNSCDVGEDCGTCATDCGVCGPAACNNGICETDEDCSSCAADCGACIDICPIAAPTVDLCGNGTCDATAGEHCLTCEVDCGICTVSTTCDNDGVCDAEDNEDCSTCSADCGACVPVRECGDGTCEPSIGESCGADGSEFGCFDDCGECQSTQDNTCGDGTCELGETCDTCSSDCGACPGSGSGELFNTGIIATGTISIGQRVDIDGDLVGGNITIGNESALGGTIQSDSNIAMGDRSKITGNVESDGNVTMSTGSRITGTLERDGSLLISSGSPAAYVGPDGTSSPGSAYISQPADVTVPSLPTLPVSPGTSDFKPASGSSPSSLAPGAYRDIKVEANLTITFSSGRYDFRGVDIQPNANIIIDARSGPVEWRIQGNFDVQSRVNFTVLDDASQWGVYAGSNIHVFPDVTFPSALYAPNGQIWIEARGVVQSGIAAQSVKFDNFVTNIDVGTINAGWSDPPDPPTPAAPVCGDTECTPETGENCNNCSTDCGACEGLPVCGNGTCDAEVEETCSSCQEDCGDCTVATSCGNGTCDAGGAENCTSCEEDCGVCVSATDCGDGVCTSGEDCGSCALDCGLCAAFEVSEFTDEFEITEACNDDQEPLWAGLSWDASTPGDSKVNIYFRSAESLAALATASEILVAVAASSAGNGGFRYGPPEENAAMEQGFQYLDDVHLAEGIPQNNNFGRLRFEIIPSTNGQQTANLLDVSLQTSCETVQ